MKLFYRELAKRVLALANTLQYENAATLLRLALSASDESQPDLLAEANVAFQFAFHPIKEENWYDHERFEEGVRYVEMCLSKNSTKIT